MEKILKSSSRPHVSVSECEGLCGDGIQDLYLATNMSESVIEPTVSYGGSANDNEDLIDIYLWKPSSIGKTTRSKISNQGVISKKRKKNYKKPNTTERKGLVTSRVGQGYYRQQIIEKWGGKCPVTGINIKSILISSHIVPWSESNDEERLDVENGILLSPLFDSLFDRHLISFRDTGEILVSKNVNKDNLERLGLNDHIKIEISKGMKKYLKKHRKKFEELSENNDE